MEEEVIFIYCLADCVVNAVSLSDHPQSLMSHAEIITFVMISALYYRCNYAITRKVISYHRYFSHLISRTRLVRRIHQIPPIVWQVMFLICKSILKTSENKKLIVDSFPVASCQNNKIFRCKLFTEKYFHGYTASKKSYFWGIKVHMLVTHDGVPVQFLFTPGHAADISAFRHFSFGEIKGSKIYGDRAYNDSHYEALLKKGYDINLVPKKKRKSRRKHSSSDEHFLLHHRGRIETTFSEIKLLMPRSIQARTAKGFLLKVLFFILAVTVKYTLKDIFSAA
jgi:hypothetical protein